MERSSRIRKMTQVAILIAVIVVLQFLSGLLSAWLPFNLSFVLIPIVIGGAALGVRYAAILGGSFGLITFLMSVTGLDAGGAYLFSARPILTFLLCISKAVLAAMASALVFRLLSTKIKIREIPYILAAAVCPIFNTGIFILYMVFGFHGVLTEWAGDTDTVYYLFFVLAGINFLIEFLLNVILCPIIGTRTEKLMK